MCVTPDGNRERSGSEVVFALLRNLMIAYQLWGAGGVLELSALAGVLRVSDHRVGGVLAYLAREGLVSLDEGAGTVRLTAEGVRHLLHGQQR